MTLEYRCSNCGYLLQTTNADAVCREIERLRAALTVIERNGWRKGTKFQEWLIECRAIAGEALRGESVDSAAETPEMPMKPR